ncbi:MAG: NTP transferase domain-containing protein [Xanthomonadales bacterium]|nr:NTP transferase domain-containing protein [Xanthomonadales bacterium]
MPTPIFHSVVLAGERPGGSPLARRFDVSAGVMVPVAGKPCLERVLHALEGSHFVGGGIVCGPAADVISGDAKLRKLLRSPAHRWLEPAAGPAASAFAAMRKLDRYPCLLTSGDHALLTPAIVDDFCRQAQAQRRVHIVIGLVPYARVRTAWPQSQRTVLKFAEGGYCGANLFAILSPRGGRALTFWRQLENDRKHPLKIARYFGFGTLLRYAFGRLPLAEALHLLSEKAGCRIGHVLLDEPRAAVDVDSVADQRLAERILSTD